MCDIHHQVQEEERFEMIGKAWVSNRAERSWAALVCGLPCYNVHFWIVGTMCIPYWTIVHPYWTVHPCTLFTCTLHNNFWAGGRRALASVAYFCSIYIFPLVRSCTVCTVYIVHMHFTVHCTLYCNAFYKKSWAICRNVKLNFASLWWEIVHIVHTRCLACRAVGFGGPLRLSIY